MRKKRNPALTALRGLLAPLVVLAVLLSFLTALSNLESGQSEEGRRTLEESIRRAAVACYAAEGIYPPDIAYLQAHYGIQVDESRYAVFYEVFGSNLMPEITVVEKGA